VASPPLTVVLAQLEEIRQNMTKESELKANILDELRLLPEVTAKKLEVVINARAHEMGSMTMPPLMESSPPCSQSL
jgi:hypothetical protein